MSINTKHEVYQNLWNNADGLDVYYPDRFNREWYSDLIREEVIVRKNQNIVSTGTVSMDWSIYNMFTVAVPVNTTFSMINPRMNSDFIIVLVKDATGTARTLTWPGTWIWQSAPVTSLTVSGEEKAFRVSYLNGKYYITGYADGSGYLPLSGGTLTGPLVLPGNASLPLQAVPYQQIREKLSAARTYYVRTDGNNSNNGLSNTPSGAFLTIQRALDIIANTIDMGGNEVTIQVADGVYNGSIGTWSPWVGAGSASVTLSGNLTTPANCTITSASPGATINTYGRSRLVLRGFKVTNTGVGTCVQASGAGHIQMDARMEFGVTGYAHVASNENSVVGLYGSPYTISGNATYHIIAVSGGFIYNVGSTVTIVGNPTLNTFCAADRLGNVQANGNTYSGTCVGTRYAVSYNSVVTTGGGANYFPGTVAGSTSTGGLYG